MLIDVKAEVFPLKKVFTISRGSRSFAEVVTVKITKDGFSGFGECVPYQRYNAVSYTHLTLPTIYSV